MSRTASHRAQSPVARRDEGFGLIEIVVSMFLLALIAIAVLPLLIQGVTTAARNATMATATQLVSAELEQARAAAAANCNAVRLFAATTTTPVTDARGTAYLVARSAGSCPVAYPGTISVRLAVQVDGETLSEVTTRLLVTGAS